MELRLLKFSQMMLQGFRVVRSFSTISSDSCQACHKLKNNDQIIPNPLLNLFIYLLQQWSHSIDNAQDCQLLAARLVFVQQKKIENLGSYSHLPSLINPVGLWPGFHELSPDGRRQILKIPNQLLSAYGDRQTIFCKVMLLTEFLLISEKFTRSSPTLLP